MPAGDLGHGGARARRPKAHRAFRWTGSETARNWLRLGCVWCYVLPRCAIDILQHCERYDGLMNRSKFNVPLGVEAQGFCLLQPLAPDDADRHCP